MPAQFHPLHRAEGHYIQSHLGISDELLLDGEKTGKDRVARASTDPPFNRTLKNPPTHRLLSMAGFQSQALGNKST